MRTFITLLLFLGSCLLASAQTKERGLFIELNGGYGQIEKFDNTHDGYGFWAPAIGYQFNSRWAAGIKTRFELGADYNFNTFGAYGQYAFWQKNRIKLFGEAAATLSVCGGLDGGDNSYSEAGLSVGAAYSLGGHCNLLLRYLHIGYSDAYHLNEDFCLGGGKFVVDGNLKRLQVGVQWIF
ncbi:outer membrane beta-barrel protein [Bacteroides sp.]|uniref:outer membrane beta-barrel protein n=1 Tax=Bacteroides sp. TaxID=29523 RepID=UPI0023D2A598|nr:outer membrane beta-barrel protein [Bacteroides sp.]MDE6215400.1 outer membrane beta-barrel protein [Bacteroides sp.]